MINQISPIKNQVHPCLLFFDIDGTILSETTGEISESTKQAIKQAQNNGHLVFINSGRSMCNIEQSIRSIGFDGYVCGCGTYIQFHDQVLLSQTISQELAKDVIDTIKSLNMDAVLEGTHNIYFSDDIKVGEWDRLYKKFMTVPNSPMCSWNDINLEYDKFCIWSNDQASFKQFYNKFKDRFDFIDRGNQIHEVVPHGCSKGTGIEFLMKHLNVPYENTFALGDSSNDLPMLEFVKNSIAMGNCTPFLRDIVSFITKDVDDNGIEYALKHYQII